MTSTTIESSVVDRIIAFTERHKLRIPSDRGAHVIHQFTMEQFNEIKALLIEAGEDVIIEPFGAYYSDFSLNIYSHPQCHGVPPLHLMEIRGGGLPKELRIEAKIVPGRILDDAWRELSPFAKGKRNQEFLKEHNLESLREMTYYEY